MYTFRQKIYIFFLKYNNTGSVSDYISMWYVWSFISSTQREKGKKRETKKEGDREKEEREKRVR